jgi:hypothetical protein
MAQSVLGWSSSRARSLLSVERERSQRTKAPQRNKSFLAVFRNDCSCDFVQCNSSSSAVALIAVNKFLLSRAVPPFPSAVLLTLLHNAAAAVSLSGFSSRDASPSDSNQSTLSVWMSTMAITAPSALSSVLQSFALRVTPLGLFAVLRQSDLIAVAVAVIEAIWLHKPLSLIGWLSIVTLAAGGVLWAGRPTTPPALHRRHHRLRR